MAKGDPALTTQIDQKLLKAHFVQADMKPGAKTQGTLKWEDGTLQPWMKPLRDDHYSNEDFAAAIHVQYPTDLPLPVPEMHGRRATFSPTEASFVYLDVGAWVGSKNEKWGGADGGSGKYIKRDFGVVCGPLVLLCTYEYAYSGEDCALWQESWAQRGEPWESVSKLIASLSHPAGSDDTELGKVVVRDAIHADPMNPRWPDNPEDWVIHVILGDMHIPVLDDEIQTYGGAPEGSERVPRYGRIDVGATEWLIHDFAEVKPGASGAKGLEKLVRWVTPLAEHKTATKVGAGVIATGATAGAVLNPAVAAVLATKGLANGAEVVENCWQKGDWSGVSEGTMKREDALKWYHYYRKRGDGQKPADIFENAGDHFRHFVARLATYAKKHQEGNAALPAKFLQLGDMLDFWVGFTCHYFESHSPDQPVLPDDQGRQAVAHWTENLFGATKQGQLVADALEEARVSLHPEYLYGNHDNYLGSAVPLTYPHKSNPKTKLERRRASYERLGLFMEHGHQWEGSNADNAGTFIPGWWMGTRSPLGMTVTQAAFIEPEPIRLFEGKAAGVVSRATDTFGQRLDQIIGSGYRFLAAGAGFYCYVMGHTHCACLTRVVVRTRSLGGQSMPSPEVRTDDPRTRVYLTHDGEEILKRKFVPASGKCPRTVSVEWNHMPGDPDKEWIALEEINTPYYQWMSTATKGLYAPNKGGPGGVVTFDDVPPGAYQATYYLSRSDDKPFKTSMEGNQDGMILIEGMSLRGDPEHEETKVVELSASGEDFHDRIVLRWVFDRERFHSREAWFGLYRQGEPDDHVSIVDPNLPAEIRRLYERPGQKPRRPAHRFFDLAPGSHPWWGAFDFTLEHPGLWDEQIEGTWELRAFNDFARKKRLGSVSFTVVREGHGGRRKRRG